MSSKRFDVMYINERTDNNGTVRSDWYKCGIAFQNEKGTISISLATLPTKVNERGEYRFTLQEPKSFGPRAEGGGNPGFGGDNIPF